MSSPLRLSIVLLLSGFLWGAGVLADDDHRRARDLYEAGEIVSLQSIIERANRIHAGRILEAELEDEDGRLVYEIEILAADGIVWEMYFDARTGDFIKQERED